MWEGVRYPCDVKQRRIELGVVATAVGPRTGQGRSIRWYCLTDHGSSHDRHATD